jgi:hypothetical protein
MKSLTFYADSDPAGEIKVPSFSVTYSDNDKHSEMLPAFFTSRLIRNCTSVELHAYLEATRTYIYIYIYIYIHISVLRLDESLGTRHA